MDCAAVAEAPLLEGASVCSMTKAVAEPLWPVPSTHFGGNSAACRWVSAAQLAPESIEHGAIGCCAARSSLQRLDTSLT